MKKTVIIAFSALIIAAIAVANWSPVARAKADEKLLRHIVLFNFKDDAPAEGIKEVEDAFRALPSKIKEIQDFEWGTNNSPEGLNDGFTHCFFVTFKSEADRAAYLPHPAHLAFISVLKPHIEKVMVIDYWAEK